MKKIALVIFAAAQIVISTKLRAQIIDPYGTVQLDFNLGLLTDSSGAAISDGALIQIIAATSGPTFTEPTPSSFVGGNLSNLILWEGAFNRSTTGIPGTMRISLIENLFGTGGSIPHLKADDALMVRWFPLLSGTTIPAEPGLTSFGEYTAADWRTATVGTIGTYNLITLSAGGALPNIDGAAQLTTAIGAVPEASSLTLAISDGLLIIALLLYRQKKRRSAA